VISAFKFVSSIVPTAVTQSKRRELAQEIVCGAGDRRISGGNSAQTGGNLWQHRGNSNLQLPILQAGCERPESQGCVSVANLAGIGQGSH
jgi:hypothetical protein